MSRENRLDFFTRGLLSLSLITSNLPATYQPPYRDYLTLDHNCAEVLPPPQQFDAIFVFGAGTYIDKRGVEYPNTYQRGRLEAAATLFAKGYSETIVLVGSGDENSVRVTIQTIRSFVEKHSHGAKEFKRRHLKIIPSISTAEDIQHIKKYMDEQDLTNAIGVSDVFHLDRLQLLSSNNELEIAFAPTECVADRFNQDDVASLIERNKSPEMAQMIMQENIAMSVINMFDKTGKKSMNWKRLVTGRPQER